jgi:hypothetical protein
MEKMEKVTDKAKNSKMTETKGKTPPISENGRTEPKKEEATKEVKTIAMVSPSDRFARAEQFANLKMKYDNIKKLDNDLKNFKIGNDSVRSTIKLTNLTGAEILIGKPEVMEEVLTICQTHINRSLVATELEVLDFTV